MTEAPVALRFDAVAQVFRGHDGASVRALADLSFAIRAHEFVSVLGPSGCGKSTLLRLASGLLSPTEGGVQVFETPMRAPRDDIGIVFQRPTLLPWLNVLNNVVFPVRHRFGRVTAEDTARARDLLALVGLTEFADKRPDELSGGMQQRVGIARALLLDPDILLMDEPFSALDALTRDEMSFELLRIWRENPKTVLFITHSIPEALLLSDRILVMSRRPGTLVEEIVVPFGRPRSPETLSDPAFARLAHDIRNLLFAKPQAA